MDQARIQIVTPAGRGSRKGNRVTALRWAGLLRSLGQRVRVRTSFDGAECDVLIVLHAVHGAPSVRAWLQAGARGALVVGLSGTDIYSTGEALDEALFEHATRIVALQPLAVERLPERFRGRARTILQSAVPCQPRPAQRGDVFEVLGVAHLRPVKDPLLAARAVRLLPEASRVRVLHVGAALDADLEERARAESLANPRWTWLGARRRSEVLQLLARARLFLQTSLSEGGANSLSEALVNDCPVLASRVPGNVGVLGEDHPGLVAAGDPQALAAALDRAERDALFLGRLGAAGRRRAPLFDPRRERAAWRALLDELAL